MLVLVSETLVTSSMVWMDDDITIYSILNLSNDLSAADPIKAILSEHFTRA
jgi:hypothetical protein